MRNFYGDCLTYYIRPLALAAKLYTIPGVKLLRWLSYATAGWQTSKFFGTMAGIAYIFVFLTMLAKASERKYHYILPFLYKVNKGDLPLNFSGVFFLV